MQVTNRAKLAVAALAVWLGALVFWSCVQSAGNEKSGGGCPTKLATSDARWQATAGGDPDCAELAAALNAESGGLGGDAGACAVVSAVMTEDRGRCRAQLASACEGFTLEVDCDVARSGAADCDAFVSGEGLSCRLRLQLR